MIVKRSTMDEETSQENHYNNRENFEESSEMNHSISNEREKKLGERADMTFSGRQQAVVIGKMFRTHQEEVAPNRNPKE